MGSVLKLFVSSTVSTVSTVSTPDMNILLAVCCLLITGVLTDLLNTGEAREEFGLQDFANIHIRNVRESRKLKKTDKKTNKKTKGKRRKNRKAKKDQKKREQTGNQKNKNWKRQNKKIGRKAETPKQSSCQTSSEVDAACIQNAIDILGYERNQILNFQKQKARIQSHNRTANNKKEKRDSFQAAASTLLEAIGGNLNSPTCKDSTSSRHVFLLPQPQLIQNF